ncbi:MAG: lipase family protein [Acidimicrobiales bacterium]
MRAESKNHPRTRSASRIGAAALAAIGLLAATPAFPAAAAAPASAAALPVPTAVPLPQDDAFYRAPIPLPSLPPGSVIRSRPVSVAALGIPLPLEAHQVMYVSSDVNGRPSAAVATIIKPLTPSATAPRPLVSYQEPWDSDSLNCAPSYEMRLGTDANEAAFPEVLAAGYALVVPDFEGLQAEFTVGVQAAHGTLDGIRAAESFLGSYLAGANTPVGLWGYSGGAQASAWASELAPTYAPELNIVGVAEGGVPPDITAIAKNVDGGAASGLEFAGAVGMSRAYPRLTTLWNAAGAAMAAKIGTECINQYVVEFAFQRMDTYTNVPDAIDLPWVQDILALSHLGNRRPASPIYIYQSLNDELIPEASANALVASYCDKGATVAYYQDPASEHISLAVSGAPAAFGYLSARFEGLPAPNTCAVPRLP